MSFGAVDLGLLLPAFAAGLLVLASHVLLGGEVLRRGIIFIDLAIAQFAGLGIVVASALGFEVGGWRMQLAAVLAALAGALLLRALERRAPEHLEALIGVGFVTAACTAIVLMSHDPHAGEHLQELLVGQILWSTWGGLWPLALVTGLVLAAWFGLRLKESPLGFYLLFAVTVTASVQVVGVYLVFASLIVPALAAGGRPGWAYAIGGAGYALGLLASALLDLPAGAAIVLALVAVAGSRSVLVGRRR
ncbi:metal ABC transporter permease [Immundisolibacter sp.]|uniref:metal ABC transporter permease n=1 Tax=Immundisolibacter sp. TaxID=1934948 RepID=UPI00263861EC|nr:metal ABC transporter permease [Immundisolibacter sp.]MDD3649924.1 metal ABC transporter permease [Immundisolibacter sp.]